MEPANAMNIINFPRWFLALEDWYSFWLDQAGLYRWVISRL